MWTWGKDTRMKKLYAIFTDYTAEQQKRELMQALSKASLQGDGSTDI